MRVTGAKYGKWGRDKYGIKPQKLDALEFYPDRLQELWRAMQEEQVSCDALPAVIRCQLHLFFSSPYCIDVDLS